MNKNSKLKCGDIYICPNGQKYTIKEVICYAKNSTIFDISNKNTNKIIKVFKTYKSFKSEHDKIANLQKAIDNNDLYKKYIISCQSDEKNYTFLMDKYDDDLFNYLRHNENIKIDIMPIVCKLIEAVKFLYKNNLFYTDLKTENIFYKENEPIDIFLGDLASIVVPNKENELSFAIITRSTFCHLVKYNNGFFNLADIKRIVIYALGMTIMDILSGCVQLSACNIEINNFFHELSDTNKKNKESFDTHSANVQTLKTYYIFTILDYIKENLNNPEYNKCIYIIKQLIETGINGVDIDGVFDRLDI